MCNVGNYEHKLDVKFVSEIGVGGDNQYVRGVLFTPARDQVAAKTFIISLV
jgi:hypothetical protein